ncbi:hypothetical protein PPL_05355 [Heterostelium album PN500]|uniref:Uncharacterized protein n=1 Tax=Heterostelium pallidum (strain ATCC 26659 / Pp 5 / PN500) TaxID=670386 RepID=D3B9Y4_HETP5|nr:hypothetical protein PPL_05355 [Heterostelium album PN500]EFA81371.1 hypothetical protein PPL_05355 [Heterostelium album PN500]|eukprot:XP_020433489.1 hypothetical protein PPL_05355 [Heterostelium album PN500]
MKKSKSVKLVFRDYNQYDVSFLVCIFGVVVVFGFKFLDLDLIFYCGTANVMLTGSRLVFDNYRLY